MSYEITYRKCVVTNSEGLVIPIIEVGCNNITEVGYGGHERRARDWQIPHRAVGHWSVHKKIVEDYVKSRVQHYIDKEDHEITDDNRKEKDAQYWGSRRFPGKGTLGSAISYLSNTNIDYDIAKEYIKIYGKDLDDLTIQDFDSGGKQKYRAEPYDISGVEDALYYQKQRNKNKRNKAKITKAEAYDPYKTRRVVKIDSGYAMKMSSRRLWYARDASSGKKFDTAGKAQARANKLNKKFDNVNAHIQEYTKQMTYA